MKALLVIDMPKNCLECPLRYFKQGDYCCPTKTLVEDDTVCPLKPLPNKLPMKSKHMQWQLGWNDCLDEITGGAE